MIPPYNIFCKLLDYIKQAICNDGSKSCFFQAPLGFDINTDPPWAHILNLKDSWTFQGLTLKYNRKKKCSL